MYGDRHHVDLTNRDDGKWLRFATEEVGEQDDTTSISSDDAWIWKASMSLARASNLTTRGGAETTVSATVAYEAFMADKDRSADVDPRDEGKDNDNQDVGENHQDMSDQADDCHDDDESSRLILDRRWIQQTKQGREANDHTENGWSQDSPDGDKAGAWSKPIATKRSVLEKVVLPEVLRKRVERDDTPSEAKKNQHGDQMKERRTSLRQRTRRPARFDDFVRRKYGVVLVDRLMPRTSSYEV
ncbi:uncharacterized protein PHALS_00723 [Plasmopara halstedii]|uniref:Uncharacterized protein n=1 Tax=Plasmopara halstedii TaxID=4781 RepID=A0A0N7L6I3_PLAHL|nr:uncharacterized protein PHALS_00723 [Plasmopara halstedii]CEG44355.1 hypothetical protein PHALS_00723 [Plasmopara halstedii]|eukprot:XP_024580724.1 hypothetical protein PHALS_00723 [Plasmopara halstedii]